MVLLFLSIFVLAAVGRQWGGSPGKLSSCLSAGRDGCRMTSAYHCAADHFLAREGRAAGRCTRAAQPRQPHASPVRGHSHQLGRRRAQDTTHWFHKGSYSGRDLEGSRKGEVISRTAHMSHKCRCTGTVFGAEEPAAFAFPSSRCLL